MNKCSDCAAVDDVVTVVLKLDMHCKPCADRLVRYVGRRKGVVEASARFHGGGDKLRVVGSIDPCEFRHFLEAKTGRKVVLFSLTRDQSCSPEDRIEAHQEKVRRECWMRIRTRLDCNGCLRKVRERVLGFGGVRRVDVEFGSGLVTVDGTFDANSLVKYLKIKLRMLIQVVELEIKTSNGEEQKNKKERSEDSAIDGDVTSDTHKKTVKKEEEEEENTKKKREEAETPKTESRDDTCTDANKKAKEEKTSETLTSNVTPKTVVGDNMSRTTDIRGKRENTTIRQKQLQRSKADDRRRNKKNETQNHSQTSKTDNRQRIEKTSEMRNQTQATKTGSKPRKEITSETHNQSQTSKADNGGNKDKTSVSRNRSQTSRTDNRKEKTSKADRLKGKPESTATTIGATSPSNEHKLKDYYNCSAIESDTLYEPYFNGPEIMSTPLLFSDENPNAVCCVM